MISKACCFWFVSVLFIRDPEGRRRGMGGGGGGQADGE